MVVVILPCSAKKQAKPDVMMMVGSIPMGSQPWVAEQWVRRMGEADGRSYVASSLYTGRGFAQGMRACEVLKAKHVLSEVYVISAGLGFVPGKRLVPTYGLTVSKDAEGGPESLPDRIVGRFEPESWWRSVCGGPYSVDMVAALNMVPIGEEILIALTARYAQMIAGDLDALQPGTKRQLRFFGRGLDGYLPPELHPQIVPVNEEVDAWVPGTLGDFPHRALWYYATKSIAP